MKLGTYFPQNGIYKLSDGTFCAVEGHDVLGCRNEVFLVNSLVALFQVVRAGATAINFLPLLLKLPNAALLTIAFTLLTLVKSAVMESGIDLQAVLYITGPQGVGKTSLARRIAGFVTRLDDPQNRPALFFDAGSTLSAIRDAMADNRDLPIIIDDLCLSASPVAQRKRLDLAAQIVRESANAAEIVKKKPGGKLIHLRCEAGVLLTAEFALDNASDLTRCIIAHVREPLNLPEELNSSFISQLAYAFLSYFLDNAEALLKELHSNIRNNTINALEDCDQERVRTNLLTLRWAFEIMLRAIAQQDGLNNQYDRLRARFDDSLHESVATQNELLQKIRANIPEGNIAYILLCGYRNKDFNLLKSQNKLDKLHKKDGVIFEGDLCLRSASLQSFVRRHNGYQNYNLSKIINELMDYGALCIQEEGTKQVKLSKDSNVPRVYRIKLDVLKNHEERY